MPPRPVPPGEIKPPSIGMHRSAAQSFGSVRHRAIPRLPSRDLDAELALVDGDGNLLRIEQVSG